MNEYQRLLMYFKIFQCNLAILHHNITGDGFFEAHAELDRWQKENGKILDSLIEYGIALSYKEPTISESVLAFAIQPVGDHSKHFGWNSGREDNAELQQPDNRADHFRYC